MVREQRFDDDEYFDGLIEVIRSGQCVALVGAGFSADSGSPTWGELVSELISRLEEEQGITAERAAAALKYLEQGDFDTAASLALETGTSLDTEQIRTAVREILKEPSPTVRDKWLTGIPFRSVLTTNYDGRPGGINRDTTAYRAVLRQTDGPRDWLDSSGLGEHRAVALHGQIEPADGPELVLTRRQYRNLLYRDPGYRTFLRSLFATTTVLFLGKSFDDEYLNELRAEILALVGDRQLDQPLAYAVVHASGFTDTERAHLRSTEGIELVRYGDADSPHDHSGFDTLLEAIHDRTNFFRVMQGELDGMRILWLDTNAADHWGSEDVDRTIAAVEAGAANLSIDRVGSLDDAIDLLDSRYDLIISNWGYSGPAASTGQQLLDHIHERKIRVPLVIFTEPGRHADENALAALGAGAFAFETSHSGLYRSIFNIAHTVRETRPKTLPAIG